MTQLDLWDYDSEEHLRPCHEIIDQGLQQAPNAWVPLLSGGHDSVCACHIASLHPKAPRPFRVYHIDTGIGAAYTRGYIEERCQQFGWELEVRRSEECDSFESFIRNKGFPGPGMHRWVYARLKERAIQRLSQEHKKGQRPVMYISGCRRRESQRRMGYTVAVRRGDGFSDEGHLRNPSRLWVAPCIEWMPENQAVHMEEYGIPRNKIKDAIGLSGECFCGSNAGEDSENKDSERAIINSHPLLADVKAEIERLEAIATELGLPNKWGHKPPKDDTPTADDWDQLPLFNMDLCIGCQK